MEALGKGTILIEEAKIGDSVKSSPTGTYSRIYSFAHKDHDTRGEYLRISIENEETIEVSDIHMLYVGGKATPAKDVKVGDKMNKEQHRVINIKVVQRSGLFAPLTESGEIMVSGVHASSYVAFLDIDPSWQVWVYDAALVPLKRVCGLNMELCKTETYSHGYSTKLVYLIDSVQYVGDLPKAVQLILVTAISPFVVTMLCLDSVLCSPILLAAGTLVFFLYRSKSFGSLKNA